MKRNSKLPVKGAVVQGQPRDLTSDLLAKIDEFEKRSTSGIDPTRDAVVMYGCLPPRRGTGLPWPGQPRQDPPWYPRPFPPPRTPTPSGEPCIPKHEDRVVEEIRKGFAELRELLLKLLSPQEEVATQAEIFLTPVSPLIRCTRWRSACARACSWCSKVQMVAGSRP